jgi:hypothetical protein
VGQRTVLGDASAVIPTNGIPERRDQNVNAFAFSHLLVADHINTLLAESAANRQAKLARSADRANPLTSVLKTVRSILATPADKPLALPPLNDYPYRS